MGDKSLKAHPKSLVFRDSHFLVWKSILDFSLMHLSMDIVFLFHAKVLPNIRELNIPVLLCILLCGFWGEGIQATSHIWVTGCRLIVFGWVGWTIMIKPYLFVGEQAIGRAASYSVYPEQGLALLVPPNFAKFSSLVGGPYMKGWKRDKDRKLGH